MLFRHFYVRMYVCECHGPCECCCAIVEITLLVTAISNLFLDDERKKFFVKDRDLCSVVDVFYRFTFKYIHMNIFA